MLQSDAAREALSQRLFVAGKGPVARGSADEPVIEAWVDGASADTVAAAADGYWAVVCAAGELLVILSGEGSLPASPLELASVDHDTLF
jgi:hypothetical protein